MPILSNCTAWAKEAGVNKIDFTYGVLYGTKKQSNKKDWHILRNISKKLPGRMKETPANKWQCSFEKDNVQVRVTIRIGVELWNYIAGHNLAFLEICTALIRSCIEPVNTKKGKHQYAIIDLEDIVSIADIPDAFNVKILQRSQFEWLFFFARHFCDEIVPGDF